MDCCDEHYEEGFCDGVNRAKREEAKKVAELRKRLTTELFPDGYSCQCEQDECETMKELINNIIDDVFGKEKKGEK